MNAKRFLIGTALAFVVGLAQAQVVFAGDETISSAQQTFQQQVEVYNEQLKDALEVRDRANMVISNDTKAAPEAPQLIEAMIASLKEVNSSVDDGSRFRVALDALAALLDQQIADLLADPDQTVREAAGSLEVRREQVVELQKSFKGLADLSSRQVIVVTEKKKLCENLVAEGDVSRAWLVVEEAISIYGLILGDSNGDVFKGPATE